MSIELDGTILGVDTQDIRDAMTAEGASIWRPTADDYGRDIERAYIRAGRDIFWDFPTREFRCVHTDVHAAQLIVDQFRARVNRRLACRIDAVNATPALLATILDQFMIDRNEPEGIQDRRAWEVLEGIAEREPAHFRYDREYYRLTWRRVGGSVQWCPVPDWSENRGMCGEYISA